MFKNYQVRHQNADVGNICTYTSSDGVERMVEVSTATTTTQSRSRYAIASEIATIQSLDGLVALIQKQLVNPGDLGRQIGRQARSQDWIHPVRAKDCLNAIKALPTGESPENYVYMECQDFLSGPSFVWDLRQGEIPKTGSQTVVPHTEVPLAPGADYFTQFTHRGESCPIVGGGWAEFYYSESKCQAVAKQAATLVGGGWSFTITRVENYQGVPLSLIILFTSHHADKVSFSLTIVGQGEIRWMPDMLLKMTHGASFFNVSDVENGGRIQAGSDSRGFLWQYP